MDKWTEAKLVMDKLTEDKLTEDKVVMDKWTEDKLTEDKLVMDKRTEDMLIVSLSHLQPSRPNGRSKTDAPYLSEYILRQARGHKHLASI